MGFSQVIAQYVNGISKQIKRRNRQGRDEFTTNEKKAIKFYGGNVQQLTALDADNVEPSGFEMKSIQDGASVKFEAA